MGAGSQYPPDSTGHDTGIRSERTRFTLGSWLDSAGLDGRLILINLAFAIVVYVIARITSRWLRRHVVSTLSVKSYGRNGAVLMGRLSSIAVYALATVIILGRWGVSSTGLLTFLGAFSVALGLSLQDVFRNFFSGLFLLMERPFRVGDRIRVRDVEGEVQGIDVRTTHVRLDNGSVVLLPNSIVFSDILTRRSQAGVLRLDFRITSRERSAMQVEQWVHDALRDLECVKQPITAPVVRSIGAEGSVLELSVLVEDAPGNVRQTVDALMPGDGSMEVERL